MSIKVIPFSNSSEAIFWSERNCEGCRTKCHFKRNMELGFVTGDITLKTAKFIGYETYGTFNELKNNDYVKLSLRCQNKDKYKSKKRKVIKNTNDLTLF